MRTQVKTMAAEASKHRELLIWITAWFVLVATCCAIAWTFALDSRTAPVQEPPIRYRLKSDWRGSALPTADRLSSSGRACEALSSESAIQLCQCREGACGHSEIICAVDCGPCGGCNGLGWDAMQPLATYAQGEYVGHERMPHVPEYRLRVDDLLEFVYRLTRDETTKPYRLNVGDEIRIESFTEPNVDRDLIIQPDGTVTLRLIGQVRVARKTLDQVRDELEESYQEFIKKPTISVTPVRVNTKLEDLRATVDSRAGTGGQFRQARVTPEGTVALPAIGSVPVQGLTLEEVFVEVNERYRAEVEGIEVTPVLVERAPRFVYVLGEVRQAGRFTLEGPTTVMQALAMAGSWNIGAHLHQVVIFRRGDDWRPIATMVDLHDALRGKDPCPAGEIWLNDSDVVVVPKSPILVHDDFIHLVFTRGVYGVLPFGTNYSFGSSSL